ncbi:MAG: hypothetical protein K6G10_01355 [Butyrivibrio sp.]|nr:hypothetical protein [Butyrivibrio sp.]
MKNKIITVCTAVIMAATMLTGCGEPKNTAGALTNNSKDYVSGLVNNVYYIRDKENNCTPIYFGNGTFEQDSITSNPSNERILWYKEDFEKIPTLYKGDSLILFTTNVVNELMTFERFEYYGYTIGLCGMETLPSGRYKVFTNKDMRCTYPYGDTDEILKLNNESVIIESLGDVKVRKPNEDDMTGSFLTRSGTIKGLTANKQYSVDIYEGSVYHNYIFTADVIALGSMEVTQRYDYEFERENLINITIPEWFHSGYYMINGAGLFRYVDGESYNEDTNFNIPNEDPTKDGSTITQSDMTAAEEFAQAMESVESDQSSEFTVREEGMVSVTVTFTVPGNYGVGDGLDEVTGIIKTPRGGSIYMINNSDGSISRSFQAEPGTYQITYYNIGIREPHVSFD